MHPIDVRLMNSSPTHWAVAGSNFVWEGRNNTTGNDTTRRQGCFTAAPLPTDF